MKMYDQVTISQTDTFPDATYCDYCGKLLDVNMLIKGRRKDPQDLRCIQTKCGEYYKITTSYLDGFPRRDSRNTTHCCPECLNKVFNAYCSSDHEYKHISIKDRFGTIPASEEDIPKLCLKNYGKQPVINPEDVMY